jgi:hypothetical protein
MLALFLISSFILYVLPGNKYFNFTFYPILLGIIAFFLVFYFRRIRLGFDFSYSFYILHFPIIN